MNLILTGKFFIKKYKVKLCDTKQNRQIIKITRKQ